MEKEKNLAKKKRISELAAKLYEPVVGAYKEKIDRSDDTDDWWDVYNCTLNDKQEYDGDSQVFIPIVRDCIESRVKRYSSLLFPPYGTQVQVVTETGDVPYETMALLEHYVRQSRLRSLAPGLFRRGDVEGQMTLMLDWKTTSHTVKYWDDEPDEEDPTRTNKVVKEQEIKTQGPEVTIIADQDLAVVPATAPTINDAEMVVVRLHLSKSAMEEYVEDGTFLKDAFEKMEKGFSEKWADRDRVADAGVRMKGKDKYYRVFMVWTKLKVEDKKVPCIVYLGGQDCVLGVEKNPYWSQKVPILSMPVDLIPGSFWGKSKISSVAQLQYQVNDAVNMGMDSAKYALLPIVMTDPVKNPNVGSMILAAAAIWETSPADTQFAQFPPLWKDAFAMVASIKAQIMESMEVNDSMLGKAPQGRKNAQAIAQQAAEGLASISDFVRRFESEMMNPLLEWFFELDQQFRDDDLLIEVEGAVGIQAKMQKIPPQQFNQRYWFKWTGVDQMMGAQRVQQMITFMNVLRGMPPQAMQGRSLDVTPIIDYASEVILGPTIAPQVIVDNRHKIAVDPHLENEILHNNMNMPVNPLDDDAEHIQVHQEGARTTGDPDGRFRLHIMAHIAQANAKAQQAAPQQPKGLPGMPGAPGVAGTPAQGAGAPRIGAAPGQQRPLQQPPGAIHQDQMPDAMAGARG